MAEVLSSMLTEVSFCWLEFLFPCSKAYDVNIAIIANYVIVKNSSGNYDPYEMQPSWTQH